MTDLVLPNADRAYIPPGKLSVYSLGPDHPKGKHKARVFAAALGLTAADADWLRDHILDAIQTEAASQAPSTEFGDRYVVDFGLSTDVGAAVVRTAWIVRRDETFPRLTSCYVL